MSKSRIKEKIESAGENRECILHDMVGSLQNVLCHERKHFNFYLQALMEVVGFERVYLKPFLEREMHSELDHIRMFGDKIVALGGIPTTEAYPFSFGGLAGRPNAHTVIETAIKMETEILAVYHELYPKAEKFAEIFGDMSIILLLEDNIEHTTEDLEEMEKILGAR
jgi:bacterioferritin (cytochrome b1)